MPTDPVIMNFILASFQHFFLVVESGYHLEIRLNEIIRYVSSENRKW